MYLPESAGALLTQGTGLNCILQVLLCRRDGCHHCGGKKGKTIGDHIPPNKLVYGSRKEVREATAQLAKALGVAPKKRPLVKVPGWHPCP